MAKTMAIVEGGITVNLEWCSDDTPQTDTRIELSGRPVAIGDTYSGGRFFRNGQAVLSLQEENDMLKKQLAELDSAYMEGVEA